MTEEGLQRQWLYQVKVEPLLTGMHIKKNVIMKIHVEMESLIKQPNKAETTQFLHTNLTYRSIAVFPTKNVICHMPHQPIHTSMNKMQHTTYLYQNSSTTSQLVYHNSEEEACFTSCNFIGRMRHTSPFQQD